jgi:AraC-like DNA-binding protein
VAVNVRTGYTCPPHFHETYSLAVFHADARIWCRGRFWRIGPGQIGMLDPREVHGGTSDSRRCSQDAFQLDPQLLIELFGSIEPRHFPSPVVDDPLLAEELSAAAARASTGSCDDLRETLRQVFIRHAVEESPKSVSGEVGETLRWVLAACVGSRVVDSSRAAGVSIWHFSRRVRAILGLSPRDFRRQQRVLTARSLIEQGNALADCAVLAGFADQAHMTRQVRSLTGVTPAALRQPK